MGEGGGGGETGVVYNFIFTPNFWGFFHTKKVGSGGGDNSMITQFSIAGPTDATCMLSFSLSLSLFIFVCVCVLGIFKQ